MKKLLSIAVTIMLVIGICSQGLIVNAKSKYEITTLEEVLEIVQSRKNSRSFNTEKIDINKINPKAIAEYTNHIFEEVETISNKLEPTEYILEDGTATNSREFELSTGTILTIEEVITVQPIENKKLTRAVISVPTGDCTVTFKYIINSDILLPDTYVAVTIFYTASQSDGLPAYRATADMQSVTPYSLSLNEVGVTDSRAEKFTYDIDARANFACTLVIEKFGWTKSPSLFGYIEWVSNVSGGLKVQTSQQFVW